MLPIDNSPALQQVKDNFLDVNSLNGVKAMGRDHDPQALKEVAKKFEAIFVQQMLKNMRAANEVFAEDSYFNSSEMKFHQDMLDQQMSLEMTSGRGIGLADALYVQMQRAYGHEAKPDLSGKEFHLDQPTPTKDLTGMVHRQQLLAALGDGQSTEPAESFGEQPFDASALAYAQTALLNTERTAASKSAVPAAVNKGGKTSVAESPAEFVAALKPYAEKAAAELNVNADVLLAQAALETGWGKHVVHTQSGENSFNLFNIKADTRWSGDKVNVSTLEYHRGVAKQERADFRRYEDYAQSFADYVSFLQTQPRYQQALEVGVDSNAYADALQEAGYATDPAYAEKIKSLLDSDPIRAAAETLVALASDPNES